MSRAVPTHDRSVLLVGALALVVAIVVAYAGVLDHTFVGYDDDDYVSKNAHVLEGLSPAGVRWAFTTGHAANWHPLTWLSHMLDVTLLGVDPGAMAMTNVVLHAVTSLLLVALLHRLTGSAIAALVAVALFALHPLRVESVAWIAERKDVLCTLFFVATLVAWCRWVERATPARYALALGCFGAALMAKPVAVTLPFVLLLFDVWPHRRIDPNRMPSLAEIGRLVVEKLPFFGLTALSIVVTLAVQAEGGAVRDALFAPFFARLANGLTSYAAYLGATLWPTDLAVFYPWSAALRDPSTEGLALLRPNVLGAATLLLALAFGSWHQRARRPWLGVGLLVFGGTLVPMLGLVQVGNQSMADRYTYVPSLGLAMIVAATVATVESAVLRRGLVVAGVAAAAILGVATSVQVATWRDGETLFRHALAVTRDNYLARFNLGTFLLHRDPPALAEARVHLEAAYALVPNHGGVRLNLGVVHWFSGRGAEALPHFEAALRLRPNDPEAHLSLGAARYEQGRVEEALQLFEAAARFGPGDVRPLANSAHVLFMEGRFAEAEAVFARALELTPADPELRAGWEAAAQQREILERAGRP